MFFRKFALTGLALAILITACGNSPTASPPTGINAIPVAAVFRDYYEAHGGLRVIGEPISAEHEENGVRVQYFRAGRLEYHPQLPEGHQIFLSNLSEERYGHSPCIAPENVAPGALYFTESCHSVSPQFRDFFQQYGSLAFFGYPVSEMYIADSRFVQHFERATIVWDSAKPIGQRFGLASLGSMACPSAACLAGFRAGNYVPPSATPTPQPTQADSVSRFYQAHNGARIFGSALASPRPGPDGALEQVFENAILYENPAAPEGVSLRSLGLQMLGRPDDPAAPMDDPNSIYFAKYGHNIVYGFYTFYKQYGGEAVFGQPITELRIEGNHFIQYYENVVIRLYLNLPSEQAAQLMDVGRQVLNAQQSQPTPPPRTSPPQSLTLISQTAHRTLLAATEQQTLEAWVYDENGIAVAGASVTFVVHTPGGDIAYVTSADGSGYASYTFALKSFTFGEFILYDVTAIYGGLSAAKSDAFLPWQGAAP